MADQTKFTAVEEAIFEAGLVGVGYNVWPDLEAAVGFDQRALGTALSDALGDFAFQMCQDAPDARIVYEKWAAWTKTETWQAAYAWFAVMKIQALKRLGFRGQDV